MKPVLTDILAPEPPTPKPVASQAVPPLSGILAPPPVTYRDFTDTKQMRQAIFDNVLNTTKTAYPLENSRYKLEVADLAYDSDKPYSLQDQKNAIMRGQSLTRQLRGTWRLVDQATGKVMDQKKTTLAHVPYVTDRGTFIYQGSEYTIANQMRLKPGVFSRVKENGILEAHFNTKPGTGPSFRLFMEPDTGVFRLGVGQSSLKLYPILRAMGVSDSDIEKHWGRELLQKNVEAEDPRAVSRAFAKLVSTRADQEVGAEDSEAIEKEAQEIPETVKALKEIVRSKSLDGGYGEVFWRPSDGETILNVGDWHGEKDYADRLAAIKKVDGVKEVRTESEMACPVGWWCISSGKSVHIKTAHELEDLPAAGKVKRDAFLYMESDKEYFQPTEDYAQCASCRLWSGPDSKRCQLFADHFEVKGTDACGLYIPGTPDPDGEPQDLVDPYNVGFVNGQVRCENCAFFDAEESYCELYARLNKEFPTVFDLKEDVKPKGCCNAQVPIGSGKEAQMRKMAQIGARISDRRWTQLWFRGKLRVSEQHGRNWVLLDVHKGLCEAAFDSLKSEGIDCEARFEHPHISVLRPEECEQLKDRFKFDWRGAAKEGLPMRFRLVRMVNLIPRGWPEMDRVWFLECESPDLVKYRKDLGFPDLPRNPDKPDHELRFHVTFAVRRAAAYKAAELLDFRSSLRNWQEPGLRKEALDTDKGGQLLNVFDRMELDPDVTESTLGQRFNTAGVPTLLRASQKLLNISKQTEDVDDRDSLAFQTLHSPEDFFAERIRKDAGQIGRKLLWRATLKGNVQHVPTGALSPQMTSVLLRSGMGMPLEETNPMDILDQNLRIVRLGEGGIPSIDAVPDESRNVQPSHFGFLDPIRAPESEKIGIDSRVSHRVRKGSDGQFYTDLLDPKSGEMTPVSASRAAKSIVAFPGEMSKPGNRVRAMVRSRQVEYVDKSDVDYELPNPNQMFSASSNLVPLISGIKGGRLLMGAKYVVQSLPLRDAEAPLVQNLSEGDTSFDDIYGDRVGAVRVQAAGVVTDIGKDYVRVKYPTGTETHELYNNFPFNRKTFIHNTPTVKIGDRVAPGQLLARSNYTDDKGTLAIGTNLRTAYMPYKGLNYEDAIVISESAAKKLSSEHMYQHYFDKQPEHQIGRKEYVSIYPTRFNRAQLQTIDEKGVVRPGTKVNFGDPLVLALNKTRHTAVHRGHKPMFTEASQTWQHEFPGEVVDVDQTKEGGWNVTVKAYMPAQEGDKLAGRYGDKGVISKIVPDDQMVQGRDGKPYEILLNPLGIISRGNPSQVYEALLGKVARARGQAFKVPSFNDKSLLDLVKKELADAKLSDTEDLLDPSTSRKIPGVLTGERFMFKLHHTAESKGKGRGDLGAYTSEGLPAKGGEFGAKRVSNMEINALLSHGATEVLRDSQVVRGQRNDDYWRAFRLGLTPPSPKVPFVYEKFLSYLQGAGINVRKDPDRLQLFAMTDKDVDKLSSGALQTGKTVENDTLAEIQGGLFDKTLTGGHNGQRWTHVGLVEPMPNPVMEEPIRRMLGLTQKKFEAVLSGVEELNGKSGPIAIKEALGRIQLDPSIQYYEGVVRDGPRSRRDNAVKVLGYLKAMKKGGLKPDEFMMTKVPVLPPALRPITQFNKMQLIADPNLLYRDLMLANSALADMKGQVGDNQLGDERLRLYNSFKAVTGLGDPVQAKTQEKGVRGLLKHVFGSSPKMGMFQRRVLGMPVDVVGRATITPNPDLNMDQVGIPEQKAWTIYRPFVVRRLIRSGMPAMQAAKAVADQSQVAQRALDEEMKRRPVIINRAPTLHRYGFMAAWPTLVKGDTLQISPVVTPGFNADFDGDAMNYHVPVTDEAVSEAIEKMLPSRNLRAASNFQTHYIPRNEFLMGLYLASTAKNDRPARIFRSREDVIRAYQRGELDLGDRVNIRG